MIHLVRVLSIPVCTDIVVDLMIEYQLPYTELAGVFRELVFELEQGVLFIAIGSTTQMETLHSSFLQLDGRIPQHEVVRRNSQLALVAS